MIRLHLPLLPPSVNEMYQIIKAKGHTMRVLSATGRKFQKEAIAFLAQTYPMELKKMEPNFPYVLYARFHVPLVENKGWPETAKTRYKRLDASNRTKALEDVLSEVSNVDDSHFLLSTGHKVQGKPERTDIWIWNLEKEESPIYAAALALR